MKLPRFGHVTDALNNLELSVHQVKSVMLVLMHVCTIKLTLNTVQ